MSGRPVESPSLSTAAGTRAYYTVTEAAAYLGVSRVTVWRLLRDGRLPVWRLGHRTTRIKASDLEALLRQREITAARAPQAASQQLSAKEHFVQFYEEPAVLLEAVAGFIGSALQAGDVGIVVATPAHRAGVEARLIGAGVDLPAARISGRYVTVDAAEALAQFMDGDVPDPDRFADVVGGLCAQATTRGGRVRIFGEMVALLWQAGQASAAVRLEALWNGLQEQLPFSLFCAYPMATLAGDSAGAVLADVCQQHTRVIPGESYTALRSTAARLRAITVLQHQAQALGAALAAERAARTEAEAALRERDEFLALAAHELKTPLTVLRGHVQLLRRRLDRFGHLEPERLRQALAVLDRGSGKLTRLAGELLESARLQKGKLTLARQDIDLVALVHQAVASAQALGDRHSFHVSAPTTLKAWVDPLRLEQVLSNLFDNARRYAPGGAVEVVVAQPAPAVLEVSVRDQGPGIPAAARGRLFERFYRAHTDDYQSGLGLGLYLSRQIVQQHGGDLSVEFPPDGGTRVTLRLPCAPQTDAGIDAGR